jgi:hypothetical protein
VGAFKAERQFLLITTKAKMPDMASPVYLELVKDLQEEMTKADDIRQNNRGSPQKDHLAMVADGVGALGWFTDSKPAEYVVELFGGAQIFGNKILKEYKDRCETRYHCTYYFNCSHSQTETMRKSNGSSRSTNSCGPSSPTSKNITSRDYNGMHKEWMLPMLFVKSNPPRMVQRLALDLQHRLRRRCQLVVSLNLLDLHHRRAWVDHQKQLHRTWALFLSSSTRVRRLRRG